jgi:hypothetical protein
MIYHPDYPDDFAREDLLWRYIDGECTPEERALVEQDAAMQQRLAELQTFDRTLRDRLTPTPRPTPEELLQFVEQTLDANRALVVGQTVQRDPSLAAEVAQIRAMLADDPFAPAAAPSSLLDTLASGVYEIINLVRVAHPVGVRGEVLRFEGPSVAITLRQEQEMGEDPTWTVRGLIEGERDDEPAVVVLRSEEPLHAWRTLATDEGLFRFSGLASGTYTLTLLFDQRQQEWRLPAFALSSSAP